MIKFGPSGNDILFYEQGYKGTENAPKWLNSLGLNAYEYSCGRGVNLSDDKAKLIGSECEKYGISISVHAPYYINLANIDDNMIEKSYDYILKSLHLVKVMGGNRIVVHTGTNGKLTREEAIELCKIRLKKLSQIVLEKGYGDCKICLETMGKYSQIGNVEEIVELCKISPIYIPTFDFGHINCIMQGALKTTEDFEKILNYAISELGIEKIKNVHIHFSKIMYNDKGEIKHLTFEDEKYGPEFKFLAEALKKLKLEPVIICESSDKMAQDSLIMKNIYENSSQI